MRHAYSYWRKESDYIQRQIIHAESFKEACEIIVGNSNFYLKPGPASASTWYMMVDSEQIAAISEKPEGVAI